MLFTNTDIDKLSENAGVKYINENFGEIILNKEANAIKEELISATESGLFNMNDVAEYITRINESNFNRSTSEKLVEMVYEAFMLSGEDINNIEEASVYLEFAGNEEKNKQFIKSLQQLENYLNDYHDWTIYAISLGDKILAEMVKASKLKDDEKGRNECKAICDRIKNIIDNYNSDPSNGKDFSAHRRNFEEFKRLSKKFNNKFSSISMEEKKALDTKLDKLIDTTLSNPKVTAWVKTSQTQKSIPQYDKLVVAFNKMKEVNRDAALDCLRNYINPYLEFQYDILRGTIGFTNYVRSLIGAENDKKLSYKIVNKLLK